MEITLLIIAIINFILLVCFLFIYLFRDKNKLSKLVNNSKIELLKELAEKKMLVTNIKFNDELRKIIDIEDLDDFEIDEEQKKHKKSSFNPNTIDKSLIEISSDLISLSELVANVNKLVDRKLTKPMSTTTITSWLMKKGLIRKQKYEVVREVVKYCVTDIGDSIGIVASSEYDGKTGEAFPTYLLSESAQKYIIDNLEHIYAKRK